MERQPTGGDRPPFPKRVCITAGMPNGNKELGFHHVGGYFVHADAFARFMRDRIGNENVLFVSGTDCFGSPIVESHRRVAAEGAFEGDVEDFVRSNHKLQVKCLNDYHIAPDFFGASALDPARDVHRALGAEIFRTLHANGRLLKITTRQFYDEEAGTFLNGRQVEGRCPIQGCASEKGYADECALGHPYEPQELIDPVSTLTGKRPGMRDVSNWYLRLPDFRQVLRDWVAAAERLPVSRDSALKAILEFLEPPAVHVKKEHLETLDALHQVLPPHTRTEGAGKSVKLVFESLEERERACALFTSNRIRFRTGKTLVPFRLTGNLEWGVPVPEIEGTSGLTFWVWPESLWAPISFTQTWLEIHGRSRDEWKEWWCSPDSCVVQFIGQDNVYFYGPAEMAIFMGMQTGAPSADVPPGQIRLPELIVNNHILYMDKKASSSGAVKPPTALELLDHYTADQLRAHFFSLGLGLRSVSFRPLALNPAPDARIGDPVLKEGNLLSNVFNRAVRTCFYTLQKYFGGKLPAGEASPEIVSEGEETILKYEGTMYRREFHLTAALLDSYVRNITKYWDKTIREATEAEDDPARVRALLDAFHMVRVAVVLLHPIAPEGCEMIREYLNVGEEFWSWARIFDPLQAFLGPDPARHEFKFLEPRVDFFKKHPSQVRGGG
ncbi:MAG: class I tRNA ligase family protein [Spirochaetales bacterium]|nr:class I tRNA ligase family protein [Spirochaetales bacterium]